VLIAGVVSSLTSSSSASFVQHGPCGSTEEQLASGRRYLPDHHRRHHVSPSCLSGWFRRILTIIMVRVDDNAGM
jgi:hypothetical protein